MSICSVQSISLFIPLGEDDVFGKQTGEKLKRKGNIKDGKRKKKKKEIKVDIYGIILFLSNNERAFSYSRGV